MFGCIQKVKYYHSVYDCYEISIKKIRFLCVLYRRIYIFICKSLAFAKSEIT